MRAPHCKDVVGSDLVGQEHVLIGVPEEARLPVAVVLEMLGKSSGRIPRSSQACSEQEQAEDHL
jgi:hypothetical protein